MLFRCRSAVIAHLMRSVPVGVHWHPRYNMLKDGFFNGAGQKRGTMLAPLFVAWVFRSTNRETLEETLIVSGDLPHPAIPHNRLKLLLEAEVQTNGGYLLLTPFARADSGAGQQLPDFTASTDANAPYWRTDQALPIVIIGQLLHQLILRCR